MTRRIFIDLATALALSITVVTAPASAQETAARPPAPPTITIDGSATAKLAPDTAILSLGVVTTRSKATDAVGENSEALAGAIAAIKAQGVPPDAITTTALELSAVTDAPKTGAPKVVGYQARNQIEVRIRTSDDVGKLAATLIDKGVNSVDDLRFSSSEEDATRDRLKGDAAKDARREAEIYAAALGLKLGRVLGIRPTVFDSTQAFRMKIAAPLAARAPVPVEPGRLDVTERVAVTFELIQ